jgi:hypothetical protein
MGLTLSQHLLSSLPRPLVEIDVTLAQTLLQFSSRNADSNASSGNSAPIWTGSNPSRLPDDGLNTLIALIKPLHKRAQGEILKALCDSLRECYTGRDQAYLTDLTRTICNILTRTVVRIAFLSISHQLNHLMGAP